MTSHLPCLPFSLWDHYQAETLQLYEVCLGLIHCYAKSSTGKYGQMVVEEEEQCDDLLQFMKMMTHLTIKDYVDFEDNGIYTEG